MLSKINKIDNLELAKIITPIQKKAIRNSAYFRSEIFNELCIKFLQKTIVGTPDFVHSIREGIKPMLFFHSRDDIKYLKKIPLNKKCLRWFITWDSIKKEIELINNAGLVYMSYSYAALAIYEYLDSKVWIDIVNHLVILKKRNLLPTNLAINEINAHIKRKKYGRTSNTKNVNDIFFNNNLPVQYSLAELYAIDKFTLLKKMLQPSDSSRYAENIYIGDLIKKSIKINDNVKEADILRLYFPLFKLLLKDCILYSKEEFENLADDQVGKDGYKSYHVYQAKRLRKLLLSPL